MERKKEEIKDNTDENDETDEIFLSETTICMNPKNSLVLLSCFRNALRSGPFFLVNSKFSVSPRYCLFFVFCPLSSTV